MPAQLIQIVDVPDLVERVHRSLLEAISSGELPPGTRLMQEDLARRLAVSRQPVLQALGLLRRDGLVMDAPGRGVVVAPLDAAMMRKTYQVRGALDALAARLAAHSKNKIDPALIREGRAAARSGDVQAMIEADLAFHRAIYEASGNELIAQSAGQHWQHLRRAMGAVLQAAPQRQSLWDEHQAIAKAIAAGDGELAAELSEQHSSRASANLSARLNEQLQRNG
ncbi:GntR family transcriptional regulator [Burkholderiales bacterium 8X]|nr:GntR family transcriptional regulator [Burkholderiales bacterium 8X]